MRKFYIYFIVALFWGAIVLISAWWNLKLVDEKLLDKITARAEFVSKTIEITRLWNAKHGGVYVKVDEKTKPNPYLKVEDRDLTSTTNIELTMMNPAYMTKLEWYHLVCLLFLWEC